MSSKSINQITLSLLAVFAAALLAVSCSSGKFKGKSGGGAANGDINEQDDGDQERRGPRVNVGANDEEEVVEVEVDDGPKVPVVEPGKAENAAYSADWKSANQIYRTYQSLTTVEPSDNAYVGLDPSPLMSISAAYEELASSLPQEPADADAMVIDSITPANIAAITKLAAYFCDALTQEPTKRAAVLPGIDFTLSPQAANPMAIATALMDAFWPPKDLATAPDFDQNAQELNNLLIDIRGEIPTATDSTGLVMGGCTAALTAAPVLLKR